MKKGQVWAHRHGQEGQRESRGGLELWSRRDRWTRGLEGGCGPAHLRSCLRRAVISSPRRAEPSSAVSTLRCSLAFSPASLRLLSSKSSRLLSRSAVAGLGAERARLTTHSPSLLSQVEGRW